MAQKNINFGTFPDDPNSDAIRNAFEKVQQNFNELYSSRNQQGVATVNNTPGAGITVNSPAGNVVISANIACVQVRTNTLAIGINANNSQYACITQSTQTLFVDLPSNITGISNITLGNAVIAKAATLASGTLTESNSAINVTQIWNNASTTFTGIVENINDNASNADSLLLDLQVNGIRKFSVNKLGLITGDAGNVSNVPGSVVTGQVTNALIAGTVYTPLQSNITGVGTITTGVWNSNIGSSATFAAGLSGANLADINGSNISGAVASATSATNASAFLQNTSIATTAYPTFTTSSANGNSQAVFNTGISANLSNMSIAATTFVGNVVATTIAGNLTTAAQPNITSLGTLTSLGVNGTITAANLTANTGVITGNGNGLSSLQGSNVLGTVANATTASTVAVAAQSASTTTYYPTFVTGTSTGAALSIDSALSYVPSTDTLTVGNVSIGTDINVTGNANVGNIGATGRITTTPSGSPPTGGYYLPGFVTNYGAGITGAGTSFSYTGGAAWMALGQWSTSVSGSGGAYVSLNKSNSSTIGTHGAVTSGTTLGAIGFSGSDGTSFVGAADIISQVDGAVSTGVLPGRLIFKTNQGGNSTTEAMRIDSSGFVGIGNINPSCRLDVSGNTRISSSLGVGTIPSGVTGEIRATNNITAYYSSDERLKENIRPIVDALDKVNNIGGKTFDWKDTYINEHGGEDGYFIRKSDFGVVAQDVQKVFPLAVRTRNDGTLAVDYEKLSALSLQAIVELTQIVNELKTEIDNLKNK